MTDATVEPSAFSFDEAKLRKSLPFALEKTDTPGVFRVPAPPAGFDPRSATAAQLKRAGVSWRRSAANKNPTARALWKQVTSQGFSFRENDAPAAAAAPRRHHRPRRLPRLPNDGGNNTTWAGSVVATGQWTGVIGSWTIPTLSKPPEPPIVENANFDGWWMSTWVGLDGYAPNGSNDLLQIGIDQTLDVNGVASTWAWYEWWMAVPPPNAPAYVNATSIPSNVMSVAPGQTVVAAVIYASSMAGQVVLLNQTNGNFFNRILAPPQSADFNGSSAEWILEVPGGGEGNYSLPKFTPLTFTGALACNCAGDLANIIYGQPTDGVILNLETANASKVLTNTSVTDNTVTIDFTG